MQLILVDDGSTDASPRLCDSLAARYQEVVALHKENGGIASARNFGLANAKGRFITFSDQDDELAKGYGSFLERIEERDADILICNAIKRYSGNTEVPIRHVGYEEFAPMARCKQMAAFLIGSVFLEPRKEVQHVGPWVWCNIFRRTFIEEHQIRFERIIGYEDDWRFMVECLIAAKAALLVPDYFYVWRIRTDSTSHRREHYNSDYSSRQERLNTIINERLLPQMDVSAERLACYQGKQRKSLLLAGVMNAARGSLAVYKSETRALLARVSPDNSLRVYCYNKQEAWLMDALIHHRLWLAYILCSLADFSQITVYPLYTLLLRFRRK